MTTLRMTKTIETRDVKVEVTVRCTSENAELLEEVFEGAVKEVFSQQSNSSKTNADPVDVDYLCDNYVPEDEYILQGVISGNDDTGRPVSFIVSPAVFHLGESKDVIVDKLPQGFKAERITLRSPAAEAFVIYDVLADGESALYKADPAGLRCTDRFLEKSLEAKLIPQGKTITLRVACLGKDVSVPSAEMPFETMP